MRKISRILIGMGILNLTVVPAWALNFKVFKMGTKPAEEAIEGAAKVPSDLMENYMAAVAAHRNRQGAAYFESLAEVGSVKTPLGLQTERKGLRSTFNKDVITVEYGTQTGPSSFVGRGAYSAKLPFGQDLGYVGEAEMSVYRSNKDPFVIEGGQVSRTATYYNNGLRAEVKVQKDFTFQERSDGNVILHQSGESVTGKVGNGGRFTGSNLGYINKTTGEALPPEVASDKAYLRNWAGHLEQAWVRKKANGQYEVIPASEAKKLFDQPIEVAVQIAEGNARKLEFQPLNGKAITIEVPKDIKGEVVQASLRFLNQNDLSQVQVVYRTYNDAEKNPARKVTEVVHKITMSKDLDSQGKVVPVAKDDGVVERSHIKLSELSAQFAESVVATGQKPSHMKMQKSSKQ